MVGKKLLVGMALAGLLTASGWAAHPQRGRDHRPTPNRGEHRGAGEHRRIEEHHRTHAQDVRGRFEGMDRNDDGRISRDEFPGNDEAFSRLDRDGDGVISGGEVREGLARRHRREHAEQRFQKIDRDGDGRLSRDEFRGSEERFRALDRNNDGFLTPDELKSRARNQ